MSAKRYILCCLVSFLCIQVASAKQPIRFYPDELQQDNKVTLSPGFSSDGTVIYFAQSECSPIWKCPQRLKKSVWTEQGWSAPIPIPLSTNDRVDWPALSPDDSTLIFSWSAPRKEYEDLDISENFDLYTLDLLNPNATPVAIDGADINRPRSGQLKSRRYFHNESLANITLAGDLYFMTERLDGIGERDIYIAKASPNGGFEDAIPLPEPINSPERDDGVWVNLNGDLMLLSYPGRGGEGGADIFVSQLVDGAWQAPVNLGPNVNSPYAEFGARLSPDGTQLVFTSDRPFDGQARGLLQVWVANVDDIAVLKEMR